MTHKLWLTILFIPLLAACEPGTDMQAAKAPAIISSEVPQTSIENVTAKDAATRMLGNPEIIVLDIRTPGEYAAGHIEGAQLINFQADDFKANLSALDRDKTYVVHCRSGGRSSKSMAAFKALGYSSILHMNGGFMDWQASGLPIAQ